MILIFIGRLSVIEKNIHVFIIFVFFLILDLYCLHASMLENKEQGE